MSGMGEDAKTVDFIRWKHPSYVEKKLRILRRNELVDLVTGAIQLYNYRNVLTTPSPVTISGSAIEQSILFVAGSCRIESMLIPLRLNKSEVWHLDSIVLTFRNRDWRVLLDEEAILFCALSLITVNCGFCSSWTGSRSDLGRNHC